MKASDFPPPLETLVATPVVIQSNKLHKEKEYELNGDHKQGEITYS
jgi:hypothetical protein